MAVTYTVDPETITFSEWHGGEEVGSGDARDIDLLRESGELDPALSQLWDAMIAGLDLSQHDDAPERPPTPAEMLEAARLSQPLWDALLAELRKQVAADEAA